MEQSKHCRATNTCWTAISPLPKTLPSPPPVAFRGRKTAPRPKSAGVRNNRAAMGPSSNHDPNSKSGRQPKEECAQNRKLLIGLRSAHHKFGKAQLRMGPGWAAFVKRISLHVGCRESRGRKSKEAWGRRHRPPQGHVAVGQLGGGSHRRCRLGADRGADGDGKRPLAAAAAESKESSPPACRQPASEAPRKQEPLRVYTNKHGDNIDTRPFLQKVYTGRSVLVDIRGGGAAAPASRTGGAAGEQKWELNEGRHLALPAAENLWFGFWTIGSGLVPGGDESRRRRGSSGGGGHGLRLRCVVGPGVHFPYQLRHHLVVLGDILLEEYTQRISAL